MIDLLAPMLLASLWIVSFFLIIDLRGRSLSYIGALLAAGVIVWKEYAFLVPDYTTGQLITATIFVLSLTVATVSDFYDMMIPRFCSIWLAPVWLLFSYLDLAPIDFRESAIGACVGYVILKGIAWLFYQATGKQGVGEGDMELLAMVGAFVGTCSTITSLYLGTIIALIVGTPYLYFIKKDMKARLPFAPALILGALLSFHICLV